MKQPAISARPRRAAVALALVCVVVATSSRAATDSTAASAPASTPASAAAPAAAPASVAAPASAAAAPAVAPQSPGELARAQIQAAVTRDWARLRTLYSPDVVYTDPGGAFRGLDAALANLERSLQPFGGKIDVTIRALYEGKDFAVAEWTAVAINDSEFTLGDGSKAPATGNEVTLHVVTIYDVKDGKIVSERNYYDGLALYGALGVMGE